MDQPFFISVLQPLSNSLNKVPAVKYHWIWNGGNQSQVFCHLAVLNGVNGGLFQPISKFHQLVVAVQLAALAQCAGPGKDGCHGVGGGLLAL